MIKLYKSLLAAAAIAVSASLTGCDDDFDRPPVIVPEATIEANTTILELKERYWQDPAKDYMTQIGQTADGKDIIIGGIIVSDDSEGNVYQRVIVQDATSAIAVRVYSSDLSTSYHYGQEVRINVSGLLIGTYRGLMMIGVEYNGSVGGMDLSEMTARAQVNGLPNQALANAYPVTIADLNNYKNAQADMMMWQTRLVTIENVSFVGAGTTSFGTPGAANYTTTKIKDEQGNTLDVSTSNKCNFAGTILPDGTGTVTAILSYFGSNWQLTFNDPETECKGFEWVEKPAPGPDTPGEFTGNGTKESPFTVDDLLVGASTPSPAYVTGYIVGWVDGASISEGAHFTVPATSASNVLIAATASETDYNKCVAVQLVSGTAVRAAVNLKDHPDNLGKKVTLQGSLEKYFGIAGVKSTTDDYTIDGQGSTPTPPPAGTTIYTGLIPTSATTDWTLTNETVWSWKNYNNAYYLNASGYGQDATLNDVLAVSPVIDLNGHASAKLSFEHAAKFQTSLKTLCGLLVREAGTSSWTPLTIPTWPEAGAWTFVNSGSIDLSAYAGKKIELAFKYGCTPSQADTWEIRNLTITE